MKVVYNKNQVRKAAEFICQHNPAASQWDDVSGDPISLETKIISMIIDSAKNEKTDFVGTGGWFIVFDRQDESVAADVYVDPSLIDDDAVVIV